MYKTVKTILNISSKKITGLPLPRLVGTGYVVVFTKPGADWLYSVVHRTLSNRWLFSGTLVLIPSRTCSEMYINAMLSKKLDGPGILEVFIEYFFLFWQYGFTLNFTRLHIVVDPDPVESASFLADPDLYPFQPNVNLNLNFFPVL